MHQVVQNKVQPPPITGPVALAPSKHVSVVENLKSNLLLHLQHDLGDKNQSKLLFTKGNSIHESQGCEDGGKLLASYQTLPAPQGQAKRKHSSDPSLQRPHDWRSCGGDVRARGELQSCSLWAPTTAKCKSCWERAAPRGNPSEARACGLQRTGMSLEPRGGPPPRPTAEAGCRGPRPAGG